MTNISVKIFDNEEGQLKNVAPRIKTILQKMGYEPILTEKVTDIDGHAERLIEDRPDIIICDNHFGDELGRQSLGFQFVSRFKPFYPDCIFVIMTQEQFTNNEFGKLFPHPDLVISKSFLNSEDAGYEKFIITELGRLIKRSKINRIVIPSHLDLAFKQLKSMGKKRRPINATEVTSLIEQMCYMERPGSENVIEAVELDRIEGGHSESVVCTMSLKGSSHHFDVPGVAKFSSRLSAEKEIENHSRYVKWTLPYTWRVDVLGTGITGEFGAVCYSFAHGGAARPVTLDSLIKVGASKEVARVISAVFDRDRQTWYAEKRDVGKDIGAYISRTKPYFVNVDDWDRKRDRLFGVLKDISTTGSIRIKERKGVFIVEVGEYEVDFSNFINFLFARNWNIPVVECICHGDMHGGNIMVKPNSADFAFIDFQNTGWHHRARDFCSLEGSIRMLCPCPPEVGTFNEYFAREVSWTLEGTDLRVPESDIPCDRQIIQLIRSQFLNNFEGSAYIEYVIASIAHSIWILSFEGSWSRWQQEILAAKILAEMIYLQKTGR